MVSENFGNILLVPKFENFVRSTGFSVRLCRPHDPQSKGKVETFVRYVKESFLQGRIFAGIDSLNSAALRWLDTEANGTTNLRTRKPPRELFREEIRHLEPVNAPRADDTLIRSVSDKYTVTVDWSVYELPRSKVKQYEQIRVEKENGRYRCTTPQMPQERRRWCDSLPWYRGKTGFCEIQRNPIHLRSLRRVGALPRETDRA